MNKENKSKLKKPWPTKAAMEQVYELNLWGNNDSEFYSGEGSHLPGLVLPYVDAIKSFLTSFDVPVSLCDLGCGDFNVGKELVKYTEKYVAVDIVPKLIEYNKQKFQEENLEFHCMDIARDDLPAADCVILRQVLQHLSNAEIQNITRKLTQFKYVILTEHLPNRDFIPNKDIISGQGTRLKKGSGVNLLEEPFNLQVTEEKQLLGIRADDLKGVLVTTLYRTF